MEEDRPRIIGMLSLEDGESDLFDLKDLPLSFLMDFGDILHKVNYSDIMRKKSLNPKIKILFYLIYIYVYVAKECKTHVVPGFFFW